MPTRIGVFSVSLAENELPGRRVQILIVVGKSTSCGVNLNIYLKT
jgi:hypothetical protein